MSWSGPSRYWLVTGALCATGVACGGEAFEVAPDDQQMEATTSAAGASPVQGGGPAECPDLRQRLSTRVGSVVERLEADRCRVPEDCRAFAVQSACGGSCRVLVGSLPDGRDAAADVQEEVGQWLTRECPADCQQPVATCVAETLPVDCVLGRCVTR